MEVELEQNLAKEEITMEPEQDEVEDENDDEGMGVKAKALTKLLKTSSV
jgi:hypothetical protein